MIGLVSVMSISGCSSQMTSNSAAVQGEGFIDLGQTNDSSVAPVQTDLQYVLDHWNDKSMTTNSHKLENILKRYESDDKRFEIALLTSVSLTYLKQDKRSEFMRSVEKMNQYITSDTELDNTTQYVLLVHKAFSEQSIELDNRTSNDRMAHSISTLLNTDR